MTRTWAGSLDIDRAHLQIGLPLIREARRRLAAEAEKCGADPKTLRFTVEHDAASPSVVARATADEGLVSALRYAFTANPFDGI